jgi:hypothetical protein
MRNEKAKEDYQKAIDYLKSLGIDFEYRIVPENPAWGKDSWGKFNFLLIFKKGKETFTSYFSQSHKKPFSFGKMTIADHKKAVERLEVENEYPGIFGALNCFVSDSDCLEYDFEEWAENLGYDPDSRKAEKTYKACISQTKGFKKLFDVDEVAQYLEDNELN